MYIYFRNEEKKLYQISSKIGCMSQGNIEYLKKHNPNLSPNKFEIFRNTVKVSKEKKYSNDEREQIRNKYGINKDDVVAIFGGNFGRPQGLDFLVDVIKEYRNKKNIKFVLIGRGTEKEKIFNEIKTNGYKNAHTYDFIPRNDYEELTRACDIGLIFLDKRFTIPNYPSKTLSYFECSLPIMAAIDKNTDYSKLLVESNSGFWVENGDIKAFKKNFNKLINDEKLRKQMGKNGHQYLVQNLNVDDAVKILERYVGEKNV